MKEKQITMNQLKVAMGCSNWSNNQFANHLCCLLHDVIRCNMDKFKEELMKGDDSSADVYKDYANMIREEITNIDEILTKNNFY